MADHRVLSLSGLCAECGPALQAEATLQLVAHRGPYYDHWLRRTIAGVLRPRLDDRDTSA